MTEEHSCSVRVWVQVADMARFSSDIHEAELSCDAAIHSAMGSARPIHTSLSQLDDPVICKDALR